MNQTSQSDTRFDVYQAVTDKIIEQLNKGTVPWHKPWRDGLPRNLISNRPYRGINVLLLLSLGYEQNYFLTFKQLKEVGGSVKKGEKATLVVYWNFVEKKEEGEEETTEKKRRSYLRYYLVYNIAQCTGIDDRVPPFEQTVHQPITACEQLIKDMRNMPRIQHKQQSAWYDPIDDLINMPKKDSFESAESYYGTLFHELIHSTGHNSRLVRRTLIEMAEFGSDAYSHEELVAEIGTAFLQAHTGIESQLEQSAAYISNWLKRLQDDKRLIISAAASAQRAADYILGFSPEKEENV